MKKGSKPSKHTVLSEDEVQQLMAACNNGPSGIRDRALIALCYKTGIRVSEALGGGENTGVMPSDLNWKDGTLRVRSGEKESGDSLCPLTASIRPEIDAWMAVRKEMGIDGRKPLFCTISEGGMKKAGQRLHRNHLNHLLVRLAEKAGIEKPVSPHVLRRSCATNLLSGGLGLNQVQCQLRHRSIASTMHYTRIAALQQTARKAQEIGW